MNVMKDHVNIPNLAFWGIITFLTFLVPIGIEYSDGQLTAVNFFIYAVLFAFIGIAGLWVELWHRPRSVELMDCGVTFNFFNRSSKKYLWREIDKINVITYPSFKRKWSNVDGTMYLRSVNGRKPKVYILHYTLALAIREHYKDAVGCYPVNSKDKLIDERCNAIQKE